MKDPLVSVIIVNWNGKHLLDDCLGSLLASSYKNKEVIFVDNASLDGSIDFVRKKYPSVKIFANKENLGYAQGHDVGFKECKGEAILFLNTDTIIEKNVISDLVEALFEDKRVGAVQSKVLIYGKKNLIDSIGSFFNFSGDLYHFGRDKDHRLPLYNKAMEIFSAKAVCLLIKKEVLKKTGLFDKDYFAYFEETDLCMRIWLAGYKVLYIPTSIVYHKGGDTAKNIDRSKMLFHSEKNRLCTYIKNLSPLFLCEVLFNTLIIYELAFIAYICSGKIKNALSVAQAIWWNIRHIGQTLQKRKFIQTHIRKVSDNSFLPRITRSVRPSYYYYQFIAQMDRYKD